MTPKAKRLRTVTDYEDAGAAIVAAFSAAIAVVRATEWGADAAIDAHAAAFDVAKAYGWDWETDEDFASWALKATEQESLIEGLRRALAHVFGRGSP